MKNQDIDNSSNTNSNASSNTGISLKELRSVLDQVGPKPTTPDAYAVSPQVYASLQKQFSNALDAEPSLPFMGIPIRIVLDERELIDMARDFYKRGKKIAVVGLPDEWIETAIMEAGR